MTEQRVGQVLDRALRRLGVRRQVREAQVREAFAAVVGPALSPLCEAVALDRGALSIATAHSALAHQLQLDAPGLIAAINARVGVDAVHRLRFVPLSRRR